MLANALESAVKNDIERKRLEVSKPLQSILRKGEEMGQKLNDAKAHMVTDIKDVAIRNGPNSSWLHAVHANGNISIGNIADVYDVVKSIDRKKAACVILLRMT